MYDQFTDILLLAHAESNLPVTNLARVLDQVVGQSSLMC